MIESFLEIAFIICYSSKFVTFHLNHRNGSVYCSGKCPQRMKNFHFKLFFYLRQSFDCDVGMKFLHYMCENSFILLHSLQMQWHMLRDMMWKVNLTKMQICCRILLKVQKISCSRGQKSFPSNHLTPWGFCCIHYYHLH